MVRGLEEDESNFLDEVSRKQELLEKQRRDEERRELNEFRISFHNPYRWQSDILQYSGNMRTTKQFTNQDQYPDSVKENKKS